jgi:hypothetical protein
MLQYERAHLVRVAEVAAKTGVEAHRLAREEQRGGLMAELVGTVLTAPELGLSREQQRAGRLAAAADAGGGVMNNEPVAATTCSIGIRPTRGLRQLSYRDMHSTVT